MHRLDTWVGWVGDVLVKRQEEEKILSCTELVQMPPHLRTLSLNRKKP